MKLFFLCSLAATALAQRALIDAPTTNQTLTPGESIIVTVAKPVCHIFSYVFEFDFSHRVK